MQMVQISTVIGSIVLGISIMGQKTIMCIMPDNGIVITDDVNKIKVM